MKASIYVADLRTARRNYRRDTRSRWYQKEAAPNDPNGTYAFQRLRRPLFTPIIDPQFKIDPGDKFFAIGSCFARGIEKALLGRNMEVLSAAPEFASLQTISKEVTGLGFTNKYNSFSILNELMWALDPKAEYPRESIVELDDGLVLDPHINQALPLAPLAETWRRRQLIQMVNRRAAQCRVIIITLGLVEAWRDKLTGMFVNFTPPVREDRYGDRYEFHVTGFGQNVDALEKIHSLLGEFGHPDVQIVVTVSPVPLMATFTNDDVVLANTHAKSLLRTAAQQWAAAHNNVHYFPSYEIVQNSDRAKAWKPDLRHVEEDVTQHIMQLFLNTYLSDTPRANGR
jgi:hypothetical protein